MAVVAVSHGIATSDLPHAILATGTIWTTQLLIDADGGCRRNDAKMDCGFGMLPLRLEPLAHGRFRDNDHLNYPLVDSHPKTQFGFPRNRLALSTEVH